MLVKFNHYFNNFFNKKTENNRVNNNIPVISKNLLDEFCFTGKIPQRSLGNVVNNKYRYIDPTPINQYGELNIHRYFKEKDFKRIEFVLNKAADYNNNHLEILLMTKNKKGNTLVDEIINNKEWSLLDTVISSISKRTVLSESPVSKIFENRKMLLHDLIHSFEEVVSINLINSVKKDENTYTSILKTSNVFEDQPLHLSIEHQLFKLSKHILKSIDKNKEILLEVLTAKNHSNQSPLYLGFNILGNNLNLKKHHDQIGQQINCLKLDFSTIDFLKKRQKLIKYDPEISKGAEETIHYILDIYKNIDSKSINAQLIKDDLQLVYENLKQNSFKWNNVNDNIKKEFFELLTYYNIEHSI